MRLRTRRRPPRPEEKDMKETKETYREVCRMGEALLKEAGIRDASVDAWYLMEAVTQKSRAEFLLCREEEMPEEEKKRYFEGIEKRAERIPLQHLLGEQEFMGFSFQVNGSVLIPRQDTEILVEEVRKILRPGMRVLDLCTGSGCIAISLALLCPGIEATGSDVSREALETARENGRRLKAEVSWLESDLFSGISGSYDVIVSNPPYIPTAQIQTLEQEVRLHEPFQALDGKEDGLYFYRKIIKQADAFLNTGGRLFFEIGWDQGKAVSERMRTAGYREVQVKKDLAGLDRVVSGIAGDRKEREKQEGLDV